MQNILIAGIIFALVVTLIVLSVLLATKNCKDPNIEKLVNSLEDSKNPIDKNNKKCLIDSLNKNNLALSQYTTAMCATKPSYQTSDQKKQQQEACAAIKGKNLQQLNNTCKM